jgi:diguanylate cyclase (GGDEF)-like protein
MKKSASSSTVVPLHAMAERLQQAAASSRAAALHAGLPQVSTQKGTVLGQRRAGEQAAISIPAAELTPSVRAALTAMQAEIAGLRVERSQLVDRLRAVEDLADRDALTSVLNRRAFERELDRVIAFSNRFGVQASLLFFDLDGFKQINDRHGHAAGDLVINAVAKLLEAKVRDSDIVGRVGGDEFGVILTKANDVDALRKGQELCAAVQSLVVPHQRSRLRVGISVGTTALQPSDTAMEALRRADGSMYADKSRLRVQSL